MWRMDCLVDELVKCKRMEVIEIVVLGMVVEAEILGWKAYEEDDDDGRLPGALLGIEELERLKWLGSLRMVGNRDKMLKYPADARWLRALGEGKKPAGKGEETGHRPQVVFEEPIGAKDYFP